MMEKTEMMKRYEAETGRKSVRGITDGIHNVWFDIWHYQYLQWLEAKADAYDRLMSGGGMSIKELANFVGLPVVQESDGTFTAHKSMPKIIKGAYFDFWSSSSEDYVEICGIPVYYTGDWRDSLTLPDGLEEK
jgi:hypothetical protein